MNVLLCVRVRVRVCASVPVNVLDAQFCFCNIEPAADRADISWASETFPETNAGQTPTRLPIETSGILNRNIRLPDGSE